MHDHGEIVSAIAGMIRNIRRDDDLAVDENTEIATLGIDSLDFVELMFNIEERYNIDIEFNANVDGTFPFATVGDAAAAVGVLVEQKFAAAA